MNSSSNYEFCSVFHCIPRMWVSPLPLFYSKSCRDCSLILLEECLVLSIDNSPPSSVSVSGTMLSTSMFRPMSSAVYNKLYFCSWFTAAVIKDHARDPK